METWSQLVCETECSPDLDLLTGKIAPLIEELKGRLESWHFFWEPDLCVRLRWRSAADKEAGHLLIKARLERTWRLADYDWQADSTLMGDKVWAQSQSDWMNGSEFSVSLLRNAKQDDCAKGADFYWARHVHLFSNQLCGTWAEEARLSVKQARYRVWLLSRTAGNEHERPTLEGLLEKLDAVSAASDLLAGCEERFVQQWRRDGRPPIVEGIDLPEDFAAKRAESGTVRD